MAIQLWIFAFAPGGGDNFFPQGNAFDIHNYEIKQIEVFQNKFVCIHVGLGQDCKTLKKLGSFYTTMGLDEKKQ